MSREEEFTKDEKSLLLYFETCLVDAYGRVAGACINKKDMEITKKFMALELIEFGRLSFKTIQKFRGNKLSQIYTHWVRFSDKAWKLAHKWRRERSERMIGRHNAQLLRESGEK